MRAKGIHTSSRNAETAPSIPAMDCDISTEAGLSLVAVLSEQLVVPPLPPLGLTSGGVTDTGADIGSQRNGIGVTVTLDRDVMRTEP